MTRRLWWCLLGIHTWGRTLGPSVYQHVCVHCGQPRTRR